MDDPIDIHRVGVPDEYRQETRTTDQTKAARNIARMVRQKLSGWEATHAEAKLLMEIQTASREYLAFIAIERGLSPATIETYSWVRSNGEYGERFFERRERMELANCLVLRAHAKANA